MPNKSEDLPWLELNFFASLSSINLLTGRKADLHIEFYTMKEFDAQQFLNTPFSKLGSVELQALWWDGHENWPKAHDLVDGPNTNSAARIHAYLHRKEGDQWNADYWYRRAGETKPDLSLEEEWVLLCRRFSGD